jgi:hypothetical protein
LFPSSFFLGFATMSILPPNDLDPNSQGEIATPVCDALHFRHGIQNMRCVDFEVEIPIPAIDGVLQWEIVREAWWTILCDYYQNPGSPLTIALEMRINGGSEVILSSQRGNEATCSIEVLSHSIVKSSAWNAYIQRLMDKLSDVCERYQVRDQIRPHWAKQWQGLKWKNQSNGSAIDMADYFKTVTFRKAIDEFKQGMNVIGQQQQNGAFDFNDCQKLFSNPVMDYLLFDIGSAPPLQTVLSDEGFYPEACACCQCVID